MRPISTRTHIAVVAGLALTAGSALPQAPVERPGTYTVKRGDTLRMPSNVFPGRIDFGVSTRISWIYADPKLTGVGGALILSATGAQGLVSGDQVTLRRPRPESGADLPDEDLAVAQVTRVTPWGTSAVILSLQDAGIVAGMKAQVTAKMP